MSPLDAENTDVRPYEDLPEDYKRILEKRQKEERSSSKSILQRMEGKHILKLILYIDERSPVLKSELYNNISRGTGMPEKIEELRELGIIQIYRSIHNTTNIVVITDKGKKVAAMIRDMLELLDS